MNDTSRKIRTILRVIAICLSLIVLRVWHLSTLQREEREKQAQLPQRRTLIQKAERGTIYDRFGIPIARNRVSYQATLYYGELMQIPSVEWRADESGRKTRFFPRREYIQRLAALLAEELSLDPQRIDDLIHSKVSLFPHAPYVLKADISEESYYHLKMREREWPGLHAEISSQRYYPFGKTACHLIGTMGLISQSQYLTLAKEIAELEQQDPIDEEAIQRLKEKAYTIHDWVGKSGLEAQYERELRGTYGRTTYEVDVRGQLLQPLEMRPPETGEDITLSISIELQKYAEELLAQDEALREGCSGWLDPTDNKRKKQKQPWIKGGAIVALDPITGEILALASHPRFDPNDFLPTQNDSLRWLETDASIGAIWDGEAPLSRERFKSKFYEESIELSWRTFLQLILPTESPIAAFFQRFNRIKDAIQLQEDQEALTYFTQINSPLRTFYQQRIDAILHNIPPADRLFAIDLCRLAIYSPAFSDALIEQIGSWTIERYRSMEQQFHRLELQVRREAAEEFHKTQFAAWRAEHQKEFLQEMRRIEKEKKHYARPYMDYLDRKERELFDHFWQERRIDLMLQAMEASDLSEEIQRDLLTTFRSFHNLDRPLLGQYPRLRHFKGEQTEQDLAAAFYPKEGFGTIRSYGFQTTAPQGSLFKLITAYEGLLQTGLTNPLTIYDEQAAGKPHPIVAYSLNKTPYYRFYKGGRLPRSSHTSLGKLDVIAAIERSSNPYFALLAGDIFRAPHDLVDAAALFGFGTKTGVGLPGEAAGNLPSDVDTNRTGLYSFSIGQHTLLVTPLQTALCFAALGNGGNLLSPQLQHPAEPHTRRTIEIPPSICKILLEGLHRVVWGKHGNTRPQVIRKLHLNKEWRENFLNLEHQMIGKSGTAEIMSQLNYNPSSTPQMYKHIWFGAISFTEQKMPELVVAVFLRYGDYGKEAAPLASEIIQKWRAINTVRRK